MDARRKQQVGGCGLAIVAACFTGWNWYTVVTRGYFYRRASLFFPAVLILGIALVLFPGYKEERLARGEDISSLRGWKLITARWWAILAVALAAAGANMALLASR
jgi:ABC-type Fe3+-siderophore transport system permease subunit